MNEIWTEKYRPTTFSHIVGQSHVVDKVKAFVKQKNMPHLMFSGPAGVGKTTLAMVIAKEFFKDLWHQNILELNASDERGIDVIRHKVKDFARTKAIGDVPFKIIYLDECDALTREAQQALRRTMENYTKTCRFILSCNYSSKIIDPIQSRCAVFKFRPLEEKELMKIIDNVEKEEGLKITEGAKKALYQVSQGDVRKTENILQSCAALSKEIDEKAIYSLASLAQPQKVVDIIELAAQNKFIESREKLLQLMTNEGLSGFDVVTQMSKEIWNTKLDEDIKLKLIERCGETEFRLTEGSDEYLQLEAFLAYIALCAQK